MNIGDMVMYDLFGGDQDLLSPSSSHDDYGVGVVISKKKKFGCQPNNSVRVVDIMTQEGKVRQFSLSYLKKI